jgi:sulfoxide reductase heme-binding subunit YedZ
MKLDPKFAKFVVMVNGCVPLAILCWDAYNHSLGANPTRFALQTTGMLALVFLMLCLTVTPARKLSGWNFLSNFRKSLGLFAFFYALIHLGIYFWFDRAMSLANLTADLIGENARLFIIFGMLSLVLMLPLALTSTNGSIKRLGAAKWKRLHSLVYPAAIAAVVHYYMQAKVAVPLAKAFIVVITVLLGYRIYAALKPAKPKPRIQTA